ncbi:MAG: PD40 domain-containing protein [Planctomycetes bacterium]|nr:PD40 domain-containing protein [Planctomycetota bacterium]
MDARRRLACFVVTLAGALIAGCGSGRFPRPASSDDTQVRRPRLPHPAPRPDERLLTEEDRSALRADLSRRLIAYDSDVSGDWEVYLTTGDGGVTHNVTNHPAVDSLIGWSRDGESLLIRTNRSGEFRELALDLSGQVRPTPVAEIVRRDYSPYRSLSEDRLTLVFARGNGGEGGVSRVFAKDTGAGVEWALSPDAAAASEPDLTPDGRWAVFVQHDEPTQIAVADTQGRLMRVITRGSGTKRWPKWRPDRGAQGAARLTAGHTPLRVGNRWTYERTSGIDRTTVEFQVLSTAKVGSRTYAILDGFFSDRGAEPLQHLVRFDEDRQCLIELQRGTEVVMLGPEQVEGRVEIAGGAVEVPAGTFADAVRCRGVEGSPPRNVDQLLAPGVGILRREESTAYSRVVFRLVRATVNGKDYPAEE